MKKFYIVLAAFAAVASLAAQQLPNPGFEDEWTDCVPWTGKGNTKAEGTTPSPWTVSNIIGANGTGALSIAKQVAGYESEKAVKVENSELSMLGGLIKQIIPGYFTLGTPWNTAQGTNKGKDGGTFGGIKFAFRPDAIAFDYIRTGAGEDKSTVLAYSWVGETSQADVPSTTETSQLGNPTKVTMIDRDRNILSMDTNTGGAVTYSDNFKLISLINYDINADTEGWSKLEIPFEYKDDAAPEKINLIFSAGDYFAASPVKGYALTIDNVRMLYYSRLSDLKFKDATIPGFDPDTYNYELDEIMPSDADKIQATTMGNSGVAKATVELDERKCEAKITVTNAEGDDVDGKNEHVYTIKFKDAGSSIADTETDAYNAGTQYFNLQGVRVNAANLVQGQTYIKVANGIATKIVAL